MQTGGFSLGVVTAPAAPAAGAFGLIAQSHISMQAQTGNYSLNVDDGTGTINIKKDTALTVSAGKYTHTVTGGPTEIKNTDNTTLLKSKNKVTVECTDRGMDIKARIRCS